MVPIVTRKPWGIVCLVLNILLPGTGTLVAAGNQEDKKYLIFGIVQLLTALIVVGFLWSIVTGVMIFVKSEPPVDA